MICLVYTHDIICGYAAWRIISAFPRTASASMIYLVPIGTFAFTVFLHLDQIAAEFQSVRNSRKIYPWLLMFLLVY